MKKMSVSHLVRSLTGVFCLFFGSLASLTEKDALVTSLQEELREAREKTINDAVRLSSL